MQWTVEIEELFISLVKQQPNLWDVTDHNYHNRYKKRISFKIIEDEILLQFPDILFCDYGKPFYFIKV